MKHLPGLFAATLVALTAQAGAETVTADDTDVLLELLRAHGEAELEKDDAGNPLIVATVRGTRFGVFYYGCTDGAGCKDIQFRTGWSNVGPYTAEDMNAWNATRRVGTALLTAEGDPAFVLSVNMAGGLPRETLDANITWWLGGLGEFIGLLGERAGARE